MAVNAHGTIESGVEGGDVSRLESRHVHDLKIVVHHPCVPERIGTLSDKCIVSDSPHSLTKLHSTPASAPASAPESGVNRHQRLCCPTSPTCVVRLPPAINTSPEVQDLGRVIVSGARRTAKCHFPRT